MFLHSIASATQLHSAILELEKKWHEKWEDVRKGIPFLVERDMKMAKKLLTERGMGYENEREL